MNTKTGEDRMTLCDDCKYDIPPAVFFHRAEKEEYKKYKKVLKKCPRERRLLITIGGDDFDCEYFERKEAKE